MNKRFADVGQADVRSARCLTSAGLGRDRCAILRLSSLDLSAESVVALEPCRLPPYPFVRPLSLLQRTWCWVGVDCTLSFLNGELMWCGRNRCSHAGFAQVVQSLLGREQVEGAAQFDVRLRTGRLALGHGRRASEVAVEERVRGSHRDAIVGGSETAPAYDRLASGIPPGRRDDSHDRSHLRRASQQARETEVPLVCHVFEVPRDYPKRTGCPVNIPLRVQDDRPVAWRSRKNAASVSAVSFCIWMWPSSGKTWPSRWLASPAERAGRLWGAIESEQTSRPVRQWENRREECGALVVGVDGPKFASARAEGRLLSIAEAADAESAPAG